MTAKRARTSRPQKPRFKVGDRVRVLDPRLVKRVGYPKCADDYTEQVQVQFKDRLNSLLGSEDIRDADIRHIDKLRERIERELCFLLLRMNRFGGSERSIHFYEDSAIVAGSVCFVEDTRRAVTGYRSNGYVGYDGEGEGPHLSAQVHHTILEIGYPANGPWQIRSADAKPFEILASHVELVVEQPSGEGEE